MPLPPSCSLAVLLLLLPLGVLSQELVQTGRYSAVATLPTDAQREPLNEIVTVRFPDTEDTVGAAIRDLLQGTGYALSDAADPAVVGFLGCPLPDVQRSLGPLTVFVALQTLSGSAFRVTVDPVRRLIGLELAPDAGTTIGTAAADKAT